MTKYSFDNIYQDMKSIYENENNCPLEQDTKTDRLLQSVASELYAISSYGDFILRQSFVQSATGEWLDKHAEIRGMRRNGSVKATGSLTFTLTSDRDYVVIIPVGTICSCSKNPLIQYVTTEAGVINMLDADTITLKAEALETGIAYNVASGQVNTLVDAPVGVISVTNEDAFVNGWEVETDLRLRERIMNTYNVSQNGINTRSLENAVLTVDGVRDCFIPSPVTQKIMSVSVVTESNTLTDSMKEEIMKVLSIKDLLDIEAQISLAKVKFFSLDVDVFVQNGYENDFDADEIQDMVSQICLSTRIGKPLEYSRISKELCKKDGIINVKVSSKQGYESAVFCNADEYLKVDKVVLNIYGTQL